MSDMKKRILHLRTVHVDLTTHLDNLTDLANAYAQMGFVANLTETELIENIKQIVAEQFLQSILHK